MDTTIDLIELRALTAVIERGSFTAAADALETDKAHVSRIVSRLENKLAAQLLHRSTRRLSVTEIGREVYERASGILAALEETEASVARSKGAPTGTLKLTAGTEFGLLAVNGWIADYFKTYPEMRVEAEFTNRVTDIIHEGFDVAIRVGALEDSELTARKLGELEYGIFASPAYIKNRGEPSAPEELENHDIIMFASGGAASWRLVRGREVAKIAVMPRYRVNNNTAAMQMAMDGIGIALLPKLLAARGIEERTLTQILREWGSIPVPVHAVFASSRYITPKVRAFVDLAAEAFKS
ncbi:MAG: LysR family transcriptional regulator [Pseudomonadota bacterium]